MPNENRLVSVGIVSNEYPFTIKSGKIFKSTKYVILCMYFGRKRELGESIGFIYLRMVYEFIPFSCSVRYLVFMFRKKRAGFYMYSLSQVSCLSY